MTKAIWGAPREPDRTPRSSVAADAANRGRNAAGACAGPAVANFVFADTGEGDARPLFEALLREGVIVRPVGNYQLPNHLRITIGTREQNERMLAALKQALA